MGSGSSRQSGCRHRAHSCKSPDAKSSHSEHTAHVACLLDRTPSNMRRAASANGMCVGRRHPPTGKEPLGVSASHDPQIKTTDSFHDILHHLSNTCHGSTCHVSTICHVSNICHGWNKILPIPRPALRPSIVGRPGLPEHRIDHGLGVLDALGDGGHHHHDPSVAAPVLRCSRQIWGSKGSK